MRAVAAVMDAVAAEDRVVRDVDINRIPHEADAVADDARPIRVVELDAVAARGRPVIALAGNEVVFDAYVVRLLDPQAEQVVGQVAVAHDCTVRTRMDVDAGVLVDQAVTRIPHDQPIDDDILCGDTDRIAFEAAAQCGSIDSLQGHRLVDHQPLPIEASFHPYHVTRLGTRDGSGDGLPLSYGDLASKRAAGGQKAKQRADPT